MKTRSADIKIEEPDLEPEELEAEPQPSTSSSASERKVKAGPASTKAKRPRHEKLPKASRRKGSRSGRLFTTKTKKLHSEKVPKASKRKARDVQVSTKAKRPRLKKFSEGADLVHLFCVICTKVVEEDGFPDEDTASEQKEELDRLATLLGTEQLDHFETRQWTLCELCQDDLIKLSSTTEKIKSLQTKANHLADVVYSHLKKKNTVVTEEQGESWDKVFKFRDQLIENRKMFAFETQPKPPGEETPEPEEIPMEFNREEANDPDYEEGEDIGKISPPKREKSTAARGRASKKVTEKKPQVYVCKYVSPGKKKEACKMSFLNKESYEMHTKAHSLSIPLGNAKLTAEQHEFKIFVDMLKQEDYQKTSQRFECPICGKGPFGTTVLERHMIKTHNLNAEILSAETAVHPQRVENDELTCTICGSKRATTTTIYIEHMLKKHNYFVCIHKGTDGKPCLAGFRKEGVIQQHMNEEHGQDVTEAEDVGTDYLDPKYQVTQCPICGSKELEKEDYIPHLREHGLYVCGAEIPRNSPAETEYCFRTFDRERQLNKHLQLCKFRNSKFDLEIARKNMIAWCRLCKHRESYVNRAAWLEHVEKHGAVPCNIYDPEKKKFCNQLFMSRPLMQSHIETEHLAELEGDSPPVDNGGLNALDLQKDGKLNEIRGLPKEGRFECKQCDEVFEVYDQDWVDHVRSHGGIICGVPDQTGSPCLAIFYYVDTLYNHCKKRHDHALDGYHQCAVCEAGGLTMEVLQRHQRLHGDTPNHICDKCGKQAKSLKAGHSCTCSAKTYICDICGFVAKKPVNLQYHKAVEHEGHREVCKICEKKYKNKLGLRNHMFKEHGEGQGAECTVCEKKFPSIGNLAQHMKVRHGEKTYKCEYEGCSWAFTKSTDLKGHTQRVHENLRPFICDICGSTFKTKWHWKMHNKKHEAGLEAGTVEEVKGNIIIDFETGQELADGSEVTVVTVVER